MWLLALAAVTSTSAAFHLGPKGHLFAVDVDRAGRVLAAGFTAEGEEAERPVVLGYGPDLMEETRLELARPGRFHGVHVDGMGRVLAVGTSGGRTLLVRFRPDGSQDFVTTGRNGGPFLSDRTDTNDRFESVDLDSQGRIVVTGVAYGGRRADRFYCRWFDFDFCWSAENTSIVARFTAEGVLDRSFAGTGYVLGRAGGRWHVGPHDELIEAIVLPDDRVVAAGWASGETYDDERTIVVRYLANGRLDPSFGDGGVVMSPPASKAGGTKEVLYGLARDGDRIVTAGFSFDKARHIQALTKTYDGAGRLVAHTLEDPRRLADSDIEYFVKVAVGPKGRRVVAGYTDDDWAYGEEVDRALIGIYDREGRRLASFCSYGPGGSIFTPETKDDAFDDVAVTEDAIYTAGTSGGRTLVARFSFGLELAP